MQLSMLEGVLKAVRAGIILFDADERVTLWNQWVEQHTRMPAADILGKTFGEIFPDMHGGRTHVALREALNNNFASLLSQTLNKAPFPLYVSDADAVTGSRMQQAVHVIPLNIAPFPRHCLIQITDVSMAVARERKLREQAGELHSQTLVDVLTGIANRRRFDLHLEEEFRRAKRNATPISLVMIDVDYFKNFNDHYGHQRGDECLEQIAAALSGLLHRARDLVARYGGEEFTLVLPDTDKEGALRLAEAMRASVEALAIEHAGTDALRHVTISLGVSTIIPEQTAGTASLIQAADRALYQAKGSGRNCVVAAADQIRSEC